MAIKLEALNFIIPISVIQEKYPNGWARCVKDHEEVIGSRVWFDDYLFRDGAVSPVEIEQLLCHWSRYGVEPTQGWYGALFWNECCVIDPLLSSPALPCEWLKITKDGQHAYLSGTNPGVVRYRS